MDLEKTHGYKDDHLDFIQQAVRKFCLNCILPILGMGLEYYTTPLAPKAACVVTEGGMVHLEPVHCPPVHQIPQTHS